MALVFPGLPKTEVQQLRERAEAAEAQLRKIEVDGVLRDIEGRKAAEQVADQVDAAIRDRKAAGELEDRRKRCWMSFKAEKARAQGEDAFRQFLDRPAASFIDDQVEAGWPPGTPAEEFERIPMPAEPLDDVSGTVLGQALAKAGVTLGEVK